MDSLPLLRQRVACGCLVLAASLALSACQRDAAVVAQQQHETVFEAPDLSNQLELQPVLAEELEAHELEGDLGCYFADSPAADPLLVARGMVQSPTTKAVMLVKFADAIVQGSATEAGGYDAIVDGSTFDTPALLVDVARVDDAGGNGALQPARAALRVRQAGLPDVILQGYWTCGA
jgi:hypothetical protein